MREYAAGIRTKIADHGRFWRGEGPSLILVPAAEQDTYDLDGYRERFADPALMLEAERARAEAIKDWPTDGIPTVRPNLGTVFVPSCLGQPYEVRPGAMPWPGETLGRDEIRDRAGRDLRTGELMERALAFYRLASDDPTIYAYHADTQGVFDIAHLLYGEELFLDIATESERCWVSELMELSLRWYVEASRILKNAVGEADDEMVHGHATGQGLYFPHAGVRISEDTATLLAPEMIEADLLPYMEQSAEPFGGAFVHYCGKHDAMFSMLCRASWCRAVDLGNPESYDPRWLAEQCAASGTVLYSRLPTDDEECPVDYVRRIGKLAAETGARMVLRATAIPESRTQGEEMLGLFHELTNNR
jgi:hypothetical protein